MGSPTSFFEASEKCVPLCFVSRFIYFGVYFYVYFSDTINWEMKLQTENICYSSRKQDCKTIKRICHVKAP